MSRKFAPVMRFVLFILGITAVLAFTVHAAPTSQTTDSSRPRFNLETIPHQQANNDSETPPDAALSVTAPTAFLSWSKVAFQSYRDGNWNIYIGNDDSSEQIALTNSGSAEIQPNFNRGTTKIAYASNSGGDYEIYAMNADGTNKTALTNNNTNDGNPSWSPDGSKIVFETYRHGEADIYVMNANGTGQTRLTTHADFDGMPTWSPDGSKIAFVSRRTGGYRIFVMNADGTGQTQLSNQAYSLRPQWSPDGTKIAFDADLDGDGWQELWYMNADGSSQTVIRNPSGQTDAWASGWSPDGDFITYTYISFVQYQGYWYWTQAFLYGVSLSGTDRIVGSTNDLDWDAHWQTSDNLLPTSAVKNLPNPSPGPIFVNWPSSDSGGSGIQNYDVQVKVGNGSWTNWLVDTTETYASYPGVGGQTYSFRVRATDNAHNVEAWPSGADTNTTVESLPPMSFVTAVPPFTRFDENLSVSWDGTDPGYSGIQTYDVQYRINNGSWINWQTDVVSTTAVIAGGNSGDEYDFRVRALDNAQNQGAWSSGANNGQTTFYQWGIEGNAYDNTGAPVTSVNINSNLPLIGQAETNVNGFFGGYLEATSSSYDISWSKSGYQSLPETSFLNGTDEEYTILMPPVNNIIVDWGFESGTWGNGWQLEGTIPAVITDGVSHTGHFSALLGEPLAFNQGTVPNVPDSLGYFFNVDNTNTGHLIYFTIPSAGFFYQQLQPDGNWLSAEFISLSENFAIDQRPSIVFEENGRIHLFWQTSSGPPNYNVTINHIQRNLNGLWSAPVALSNAGNSYSNIHPAVDSLGKIHLLFNKRAPITNDVELFYISRTNNIWGTPVKISVNNYFQIHSDVGQTNIQTDSDGTVYVIWVEKVSGLDLLFYKELRPGQGWQPTIRLLPSFTNPDHTFYQMEFLIDNNDNLYLFWQNSESTGDHFLLEKHANNDWQAPMQFENFGYQSIIRPEYAISPKGEIFIAHVSFFDGEQKIILRVRDRYGVWQEPRELRKETEDADQAYIMGQIDMDVDASSTVHIIWSEIIDPDSIDTNTMEYQIIYARKRIIGKPEAQEIWSGLGEANSFYFPPTIYANLTGQPTMFWLANSNAPLHFVTPQASNNSGTYAFSTQVTIPSSMSTPVLSFLYDLAGTIPYEGEEFKVTVNDGSTSTTLLATSAAASWNHFWYDMTPWANKTVTISFELLEASNTSVSHVTIDEITLGTSYPDLWVTNNHSKGAIGERVTHTIAFSNQGGALAENVVVTYNIPAGLAYRGSNLAPSSVSSQEIRWEIGNLVAKGETQTIEIELEILPTAPSFNVIFGQVEISSASIELELLNNNATGTTFIGTETFLPIIVTP